MGKTKPKYIAEGFREDAGKLLNDFNQVNSVEFTDFAEKWKEHYFSLVFMGRPDQTELTEFTNEMFKISAEFLSSSIRNMKIGGVYLLYSLYLNQISDPPIKIRIEMDHWKIIKSLRMEAISKAYKSLQYVIEYMIKNCFIFVTHQMLMGPHTSCLHTKTKSPDVSSTLKENYKKDLLGYCASNNLLKLQDLHNKSMEEKKNLGDHGNELHLDNSSLSFEEMFEELQCLVNPPSSSSTSNKPESLGVRRAKLKARAFKNLTKTRFGESEDEEEIIDSPPKLNKRVCFKKRGSRAPPADRRVGRPKKNPKPVTPPEPVSDDEIDISHLVSQQQEFYLPPIKNRKTRTRRDHYYKVSPKRDDDYSSDQDDPV